MKNFWHMQMHQPNSPVGLEKEILTNLGVIGLGIWEEEAAGQQEAFKSKMQEGDIVAIKRGTKLIALVEVTGSYFEEKIEGGLAWLERRRKVKVLDWYQPELGLKVSPRGTLIRCDQDSDALSTKSILKWYELIQTGKMKTEVIELLKYKKQIILQGPPGTGKTYLAKKIAKEITRKKEIAIEDISTLIKPGLVISSSTNYTEYTVLSISNTAVQVQLKNEGKDYPISFRDIQKAYSTKLWKGGQKNGSDPYAAAIAKYIFTNQLVELGEFKLIQFHPAYSYEDFVRGIVVETEGGTPSYRSINKIFAELAEAALQNYNDSQKQPEEVSKEKLLERYLNDFKEDLATKIDESDEGKFVLQGTSTYLFQVEEDAVRYVGDNWKRHSAGLRLLFSDIKILYLSNAKTRKDVTANPNISSLSRSHASYTLRVLDLFKAFMNGKSLVVNHQQKIDEIPFVLIIDEINRANLSSVLGELIYGLEYRGKPIESMYEVDGDRKMIIPPNLYVIGTMNTADRSVGHIDYAIRRRFAFVDVLPNKQPIIDVIKDQGTQEKALKLFGQVSELFGDAFLNPDFKAKEVQLGHSYFLAEDEDKLRLKLEYEIKPLLHEYIKDGILKEKASTIVETLSF